MSATPNNIEQEIDIQDKSTFQRKPAHFLQKNQILPNSLPYDNNLTSEAIHLLIALNALPENWKVFRQDVMRRLNWGKKKFKNAVDVCVQFGYMLCTQNQDENGQFLPNKYEFDIRPSFLTENQQKPPDNQYEPETPQGSTDEGSTDKEPYSSSSLDKNKDREERKSVSFFLSSDDKKKQQLLTPFLQDNAFYNFLPSLMKSDFIVLDNAVKAVEQWHENRLRKGEDGVSCWGTAICKAVEKGWKPFKGKEDIHKEIEERKDNRLNNIDLVKKEINSLYNQYSHKASYEFSFTPSDFCVMVRIGGQQTPLPYEQDDCLKVLKSLINRYLMS